MNSYDSNINTNTKQGLKLKEDFFKYFIYWRWFLLSIFVFIGISIVYLRYAQVKYSSTVNIIFKNDNGPDLGELMPFSDFGMTNNSNVKHNQIEILKSRSLIESTIKHLKLNKTYIKKGLVKESEVYGADCPIIIDFVEENDEYYSLDSLFVIEGVSRDKFVLKNEKGIKQGEHFYDKKVETSVGTIIVYKNKGFNFKSNNDFIFQILFKIKPLSTVTSSYKSLLTVASLSKKTEIVKLSIVGAISSKSEDFLRTIVEIYNQNTIDDERSVSRKTISFIDDRLELISSDLNSLEVGTELFKKNNKVTDIFSQASIYLSSAESYENLMIKAQTDLNINESMIKFLDEKSDNELIPDGIVEGNGGLSLFISEYNKILLEKNRIVSNSSQKNPIALGYSEKLNSIKLNIKESLLSQKKATQIKIDDLNKQENIIASRISKIPQQEREYREIIRMQEIKETLFLFLIQKREDAAILMQIATPISKIIDPPFTNVIPVAPKKIAAIFLGLILGLIFPAVIIYMIDLFDSKIKTRNDVEDFIPGFPYLGDIPRLNSEDGDIMPESRTSSAEALRILRTNADFLLLNNRVEGKAKTIFISSTTPGEGKTFVSYNLSKTIAFTNKKVLLIGFDIRKPKLDEYIDIPNIGVTNFLMNDNLNLDDLVVKHPKLKNFSVLPAGVIPPNPSELLLNSKVDYMFEKLRQDYDYIVVDTAPLSLVTDTILISKHADLFIYTIRYNYLEKEMLEFVRNTYQEKKVNNLAFILNDTVSETKGYGYGYYDREESRKAKKKWYQFGK